MYTLEGSAQAYMYNVGLDAPLSHWMQLALFMAVKAKATKRASDYPRHLHQLS